MTKPVDRSKRPRRHPKDWAKKVRDGNSMILKIRDLKRKQPRPSS